MNRYLRAAIAVLVSICVLPFLACSSPGSTTSSSPLSIVDQLGRTVSIDNTPQRIISLAPSNTEILFALGLGDRVVGVTDFDDYPSEVKEKQSIGGFRDPNLEKVVSLSPDLILAAPIHSTQVIPQLENKGLTTVALAPTTLDEVLQAITLVGQITGTSAKASVLVDSMQKRIKAVTDKTDKLTPYQRPKVLYVVWHDPLMGSGVGTFHDELIKKAGGVNMITDATGYPTISLETVVQDSPDVILAGIGMGAGEDAPLTFAKEEPRLRDVSARVNNRVFGVDSDTSGRAGPRIVDVLEEFARLIHPELFK